MPNIYLVNRGGHVIDDAYRYVGKDNSIINLTTGDIRGLSANKAFRIMLKKLKDSKPDDYIIPSGLQTLNMVAAGIFVSMHGRLNLLIFKRGKDPSKPGKYVDRCIDFSTCEECCDE